VVREHFETFRARVTAQGDGRGLPPFVEPAFRAFLTCGALSGGFARFRCAACGYDRFVAFSCKGRGLWLYCFLSSGRPFTSHRSQGSPGRGRERDGRSIDDANDVLTRLIERIRRGS